MANEYTSAADQVLAQKQQQSRDQTQALLQQLIQGRQGQQHLAQQGQQAQDLATAKDQMEQNREGRSQTALRGLLGLGPNDAVPEGTGVALSAGGGAAATKGFNPATAQHQQNRDQSKEAQALGKLGSAITPAEDLLSTNKRFQESLDLGSAVGDKNAAIMAARMGEGMKARIQQGIIQEFMKGGDSAQGAVAKAQNWLDGNASSPLPPGARNQLRALGQMHYTDAKRSYDSAMQQAQQQAPLVAPGMAASGALPTFTSSWGKRGAQDAAELDKRFTARQQQGASNPQQEVQQQQQAPGGLKGFLSGIWNGRQPPAPMQAQPQSNIPSPQAPTSQAAPQAPSQTAPQGMGAAPDANALMQRLQELERKRNGS